MCITRSYASPGDKSQQWLPSQGRNDRRPRGDFMRTRYEVPKDEPITLVRHQSNRRASSETKEQIVGPKTKLKPAGKIRRAKVEFFPARFDFVFGPTICPCWVSEDDRGDDASLVGPQHQIRFALQFSSEFIQNYTKFGSSAPCCVTAE